MIFSGCNSHPSKARWQDGREPDGRLRDKTYQAPDMRRVWIDKGNGKQRPLGISCIEDKIVQRAVTDIHGYTG